MINVSFYVRGITPIKAGYREGLQTIIIGCEGFFFLKNQMDTAGALK